MGSPGAHLGRARITPHDAVRIVLGLIVLSAALLKGHQLATQPVAGTSLLTSRWFLIGVVEFELFFGLWLLCGLHPRRTWQAALLCFSAFAGVSLYKALTGEATCGCFGRVPVNPWYTVVLDLAAVTALLRWPPATRAETSPLPVAAPGRRPSEASPRAVAAEGPGVRAGTGTRLGRVLGISLLAGIPAALVMGSYQAATFDEAGDILGDSEFVVLEPEKWGGKRFPLLNYIDIGEQLAESEWIVVLYHHDCPNCQEALSKYEASASEFAGHFDSLRVALVEIPRYGDSGERFVSCGSLCVSGRLKDTKEWFVVVPAEVVLHGGTVIGMAGGQRFRAQRVSADWLVADRSIE